MDGRVGVGPCEVAGEPQDDPGQHDADRHRGRRHHPRIAGQRTDQGGDGGQVGEAGRQVDEGGDGGQHGTGGRRGVEAAVDRGQAGLLAADAGDRDAQHRGQRTDRGHDQREHQALLAERGLAQDERGDQRDGVGLEQVGGHAGAVADVVADVVGDGGGVARVVLGDRLLDLADQVGPDVRGLGEYAAADPHEHGQQGGAEAEALEHGRRLLAVEQHHRRGAEQAETDHAHADHTTGPEGDPGTLDAAVVTHRGGRHPDVGAHRQPHAQIADGRREAGAEQEEHRPADLHRQVAGQQEEQPEGHHREDAEGAELAAEVCRRALLDRASDLLHAGGALVLGQHLAAQPDRVEQTDRRDSGDCPDDGQAGAAQLQHASSSTRGL